MASAPIAGGTPAADERGVMGLTAMIAPAVFAFLHLSLTPIGVIVSAPGATDLCPAPGQVRAALARQLGGDQDAMSGWIIRYQPIGLTTLAVEVSDPSRVVLARRQVAADRARCEAAAETVAAIGIRAFRPLDWTRVDTRDASPTTPVIEVAQPVADAPSRPRAPRVTVAAGPAFVSAPAAAANLVVDAGVSIVGPLGIRVGGLLLPMHNQEPAGRDGSASLTQVALYGALTCAAHVQRFQLEAGPALGVNLDSARTENLSAPSAGRRTAVGAGALAGVTLPLAAEWRIGFIATLLAPLAKSDFSVTTNGRQELVLRPAALSGFAALRVERVFFP
jgi:hypothetical protein